MWKSDLQLTYDAIHGAFKEGKLTAAQARDAWGKASMYSGLSPKAAAKAMAPFQAPAKQTRQPRAASVQEASSGPERFAHLVPLRRGRRDEGSAGQARQAAAPDTAYAEAARIIAAGAYSRGETPPTMTASTIKREMSLAVSDPKAVAERILAAGRGDAGR